MNVSIGYHTFSISKLLTQEQATVIFRRFKELCKKGEFAIIKLQNYGYNPCDRYYKFTYKNNSKGITWIIKFGIGGFHRNGELHSCSVKAVINPKILTGEKTYVVAANSAHLRDVEYFFNLEANRISPLLNDFYNYNINRLDYCINFNVFELIKGCPDSLKPQLPKMIMQLIRKGDIPNHFIEKYKDIEQFYLESNSVVINCYWKYFELLKNYPECVSLNESFDIIRFEVQCKYHKMCTLKTALKNKDESVNEYILSSLSFSKDGDSFVEQHKIQRNDAVVAAEGLLSDKHCFGIINNYYAKIIKPGDYYSFQKAKNRINEEVPSWCKAQRLIETLEYIEKQGGIAKAKSTLNKDALDNFRRSLRELKELKINPVVIPKEWGIAFIPNLLDKYCQLIALEEIDKIKMM